MGDELKFPQRWEFRRNEDDFDSPSDDSKSNSISEPVFKGKGLVSGLLSLDDDETSNARRLQPNLNHHPGFEGQIEFGKTKEKKIKGSKKNDVGNSKMKRDSHEKVGSKKNKTSVYDPAVLDDVKSFTESLLEDLQATRENLFAWMREEINKLVADDNAPRKRIKGASGGKKVKSQRQKNIRKKTNVQNQKNFEKKPKLQHQENSKESTKEQHLASNGTIIHMQQQNNFEEYIEVQHQNNNEEDDQVQHQKNFISGMRVPKCNVESLEMFVKTTTEADANNHYQVLVDQVDYGKATGSIANEKGERIALTANSKLQSGSSDKNVDVQHPKTIVLAIRAQNCNNGSSKKSVASKKTAGSGKVNQAAEERLFYSQAMGSAASYEKDKARRSRLSVEQKFSTNPSDRVGSSLYLTSPTVLTESPDLNCEIDSSLSNYIPPRITGNKNSVNLDGANQMPDFSTYCGYLPSIELEESRGNFAEMGSRDTSHVDQNGIPSSSNGTGFQVPIHRGMGTGFSISGQLFCENLPQENYNTLGLRTNGGARTFSGRNYALSDHWFANNLHSHPNDKADSRLLPYQIPSIRDSYLFSN